jgi:hypothetical protein
MSSRTLALPIVCLATYLAGCSADPSAATLTSSPAPREIAVASLANVFRPDLAGLNAGVAFPASSIIGPCAETLQQGASAVTLTGSAEGVAVVFTSAATAKEAALSDRACYAKRPFLSVAGGDVTEPVNFQVFLIAGHRSVVAQYSNVVVDVAYSEPFDVYTLSRALRKYFDDPS